VLRRSFIKVFVSSFLFAFLGVRAKAEQPYSFIHGVASGDPLDDGVILWTRVSGAGGEAVPVDWQVATDSSMKSVIREGRIETNADRDYTVKVDVRELPSGSELYYRFVAGGVASAVGRTRTLPAGTIDVASFAVVSCSNYPTGYFHAYREIAKRTDIDAVIHLGDYIYEYGHGGYATEYAEQLDRIPDPAGELITLADYRRRHAQYKADQDSKAMHAAHPLIAVWDDHELVNDAWRDGAENHNEGEGDWFGRLDAAIRAYLEWMPVRAEADGPGTRIFREFRFGNLLSLIMLDTRLHGRDRQPVLDIEMSDDDIKQVLGDPDRRMLGAEQSEWLDDALLRASETIWQVIGQQVMVSTVHAPSLGPLLDPEGDSQPGESRLPREVLDQHIVMSKKNPPLLLDTWDGYDAARQRMFQSLKAGASNPVFLSGDLHTSLAGNLVPSGEETAVAVEFMGPSVTSPGFAEYLPERHPGAVRDATLALNPNLAYMETDRRGWLHMTFTAHRCTGEWHLLDSIRSTEYSVAVDKRLSVTVGKIAEGLYPG
jgi:alkaline phosphatase D